MADSVYGSETFNAGGIGSKDLPAVSDQGFSVSDMIGRVWNNISGTTAANVASRAEAEKNRLFNSVEAQKQRDHELYMSNTAYQRAVADMRAAGLNPAALAGFTGAGQAASSSSSSAASYSGGVSAKASGKNSSILGSLLRSVIALALFK